MSIHDFLEEFLGHEKFWFSKTECEDLYLSKKYGHLLISNGEQANVFVDGTPRDHLAYTVMYDQLPRHICRSEERAETECIEYFLRLSLQHYVHIDVDSLTDLEWCFAHLPIRHTQDPLNIAKVANEAWKRARPGCHPFLFRFLKATYTRCPTSDQTPFISTSYVKTKFAPVKHADTLAFIPTRSVLPIDSKNPVVKAVKKALDAHRPEKLVMSISGGSDSMTAFHIIHGLREAYKYDIEVVMVNYTNRDTAYDEETFVTEWVNSLGYPLHVRQLWEIKRKKCTEHDMRSVYEKYTRNVRYSTYRNIGGDAMVVMGHNKDDCLENILENISNCHKYDNLFGMDTVVQQDGITFFRPLLSIPKDDIVAYAVKHQIPFLPNSTPPHFHRGKIRNSVVPVLNAWNDLFIPGLFHMKEALADMHKIVDMNADTFVKKFDAYHTACVDKSYMKMGEYFWKLSLRKMFPNEKLSNKMFMSLLELLSRAPENCRFEINKNIRLTMKTSGDDVCMRFSYVI
jgi:tRNA(Ile)-lysidine synthetase-like protein